MSGPTFTYRLPNGRDITLPSDISQGEFRAAVRSAMSGLSFGPRQASPVSSGVQIGTGGGKVSTVTPDESKWKPGDPLVAGTGAPDRIMNQILTYPGRILEAGKKAVTEPVQAVQAAYGAGSRSERAVKVGAHLLNAAAGGLEAAYRTLDWPVFMAFDAGSPVAEDIGGALDGEHGRRMAGAVMNLAPALFTGSVRTGASTAAILGGGVAAQEGMRKLTETEWARKNFSPAALQLANEAAGSAGFIAAILGMKHIGKVEALRGDLPRTLELSAKVSKNAADFQDNVSAHPLYPYLEPAARAREPLRVERTSDEDAPFSVRAGSQEIGKFQSRTEAENVVRAGETMRKYRAKTPAQFFRNFTAEKGSFNKVSPASMKEIAGKDLKLASTLARSEGRLNVSDRLSMLSDAIERTNLAVSRGRLREATSEAEGIKRMASDPETARYIRRATKSIQNTSDMLAVFDENNFDPGAYAEAAARMGNTHDAEQLGKMGQLHDMLIGAVKRGDVAESSNLADRLARLTRKNIRSMAWYREALGDRSGAFSPSDVAELRSQNRKIVKVGTQAGMPVYFDMDTRGLFALVPSRDEAGHAEYQAVTVPPDMVKFESQPWADFAKAQGLGNPAASDAYNQVLGEYQDRIRQAQLNMKMAQPGQDPEFVRRRVQNEVAPAVVQDLQQRYPGLNVRDVINTREANERVRRAALESAVSPATGPQAAPKPGVEPAKGDIRDFLQDPARYRRFSSGQLGRKLDQLARFANVDARDRAGKYGTYYQFYSDGKPIKGLTVKSLDDAEQMLSLHRELRGAGVNSLPELRAYHLVSQPVGTVAKEQLADMAVLEQIPKGRRDGMFSILKKLKDFEYRKIPTREGDKFVAYSKGRPVDGTIVDTEEQARMMDRAVRYAKQEKLGSLQSVSLASRGEIVSSAKRPETPAQKKEPAPSVEAELMGPKGQTYEIPEIPQEIQRPGTEPGPAGAGASIAKPGDRVKLKNVATPITVEAVNPDGSLTYRTPELGPNTVPASEVEAVNPGGLQRVVQVTPASADQGHTASGAPILAVQGKRSVLRVGMNEVRTGRYAVVELGDLVPSHDAMTFADNPAYPHRNGVSINPRDYTIEANRAHVDQGASRFDPGVALADVEAVSIGPPKVGPDGTVIGHNGMTMMLQRAAKMYPDQYLAYKDRLMQSLDQFGIRKEDISSLENPVLVSIIDKPEYSTEELNRYNFDPQKGETSGERSAKLSAMLKEDPTFEHAVMSTIAKYDDLSSFYKSRDDTEFLLRQLVDRGVIPANKIQEYWSNSGFTQSGQDLVDDAILGAVLQPSVVSEVSNAGIRAMGNAIANAYGPILRSAKISPEYDLRQWLNGAVMAQSGFRSSPKVATLRDYLNQGDLYEKIEYPPETIALNVASNAGPRIFKSFVESYNKSAELSAQGGGLFGQSEKMSPLRTLYAVAAKRLPPKAQEELVSIDPAYAPYADEARKSNEQGALFLKNNMSVASMSPDAQLAAIRFTGDMKSVIDGLYPDRVTRLVKAWQDKVVTGEHLEFRGQHIDKPEDEAVIAQSIRNPNKEYSLVIYKGADGNVLSTEVFSVGAPGATIGPITIKPHILDRMKALGATNFSFAHNHPGADPDFSPEDVKTYAMVKADPHLGQMLDNFLVVDTGAFSVLGLGDVQLGGVRTYTDAGPSVRLPLRTDDWFYRPEMDVLGVAKANALGVKNIKDVVDRVREVSLASRQPLLIGIGATGDVRSVDAVPSSWRSPEISSYMRSLIGKDGTERFHVLLPYGSVAEHGITGSRLPVGWERTSRLRFLKEEDLPAFSGTGELQQLMKSGQVEVLVLTTPNDDLATIRSPRPYPSDEIAVERSRRIRETGELDPYIVRQARKEFFDNPVAFIDEALTPESGMVRENNAYTRVKDLMKWFRDDVYYSLISPEVASPRARGAAAVTGEEIARYQHAQSVIINQLQKSWSYWHDALRGNKGQDRVVEFLDNIEKRRLSPKDFSQDGEVLAAMAQQVRTALDRAYQRESQYGLAGKFLRDYFPHLWDRRDINEKFIQNIVSPGKKVGSDPYENTRLIQYVIQGLNRGLHLRSANPIDLVVSRLFDSERMMMQQDALNKLTRAGLLQKTGKPGYTRFEGPNDAVYFAPKDVFRVLDNAYGIDPRKLSNKSLWTMDNPLGGFFRTAMGIKNYVVPVKLSMSLFHPVHIMSIGQSAFASTTYAKILDGTITPEAAVRELAKDNFSAWDKVGWDVVRNWDTPEKASPEGKEAMRLIELGGGAVTRASRYYSETLNFQQTMKDAWASGPVRRWWNLPLEFVRHMTVAYQAPMFEEWIPTMKVASYLRDIRERMEADPSLNSPDNWLKLRVEARKAWQRADNDFGMVNYQTIFARRMLKDIGIGMNLSLGWTLGFIRMYGGATYDAAAYGRRMIDSWRGRTVEEIGSEYNDILNKTKFDWKTPQTRRLAFVADYTFRAMAYAGLLSWALTGQPPSQLMDYIFPRLTPDGKRRLSTPFYTRDMYNMAHDVATQGIGEGLWKYSAGKIQPSINLLSELWNNEDFYGYQIVDPTAPLGRRALQLGSYTITSLLPISMTSVSEAAPLKERALAAAGFTKAPATATRSETANRIQDLYRERFAGHRPYQKGQQVRAIREIDDALEFGDEKKAADLESEAVQKGLMTQEQVDKFLSNRQKKLDASVTQFQRLGEYGNQDQLDILKKAPAEELAKYVPVARLQIRQMMPQLAEDYQNIRDYWESLSPEARNAITRTGKKNEEDLLKRLGIDGRDDFVKRITGGWGGYQP